MFGKEKIIDFNPDAPHTIKIEFCGGWNYAPIVEIAIQKIERESEFKG